jgi:hypothetical protein
MEKLLPLKIEGAKVEGVSIQFNEDNVKWEAVVALIINSDQQLTTISVGNTSWDEKKKAVLPIEGYDLLGKLKVLLEAAVVQTLNGLSNTIEHHADV